MIGRRGEGSKVGGIREKLAFFDFYFQGVNYLLPFSLLCKMSTVVHVDGCFNYLFRMGNYTKSKRNRKNVAIFFFSRVLTIKPFWPSQALKLAQIYTEK
jgi:hypothetical protein